MKQAQPIPVVFLIGQIGKGGSERQLYLLLKNLDRGRFLPSVVVFNPSPNRTYRPDLEALGIEVVELPEELGGVWRRARWLWSFLRSRRAKIVHSWTVHDNPYAGIVGRLSGVFVRLGSVRSSLGHEGFLRLPALLRFLTLHAVTTLVVNSRAVQRELIERGFPPSRVFVLPNCVERVDPDGPVAELLEFGIEAHHVVIGIVGNLRPVKNHARFVQAMARVLPSNPDVQVLIVGHPIDSYPGIREALLDEIGRQGLGDRIKLTGFRDDVPAIMRRLDLLCLTSDNEGMPNVILEAMAAGVPVVSTAVGGVRELVRHGETGFMVEPEDVDALVAAVTSLVDNQELRRRFGAKGRERVQRWHDCAVAARRLENLYEAMLSARSQSIGPRFPGGEAR